MFKQHSDPHSFVFSTAFAERKSHQKTQKRTPPAQARGVFLFHG